jgi:phosphodiesterase/alkaline phosphatase D-like protein
MLDWNNSAGDNITYGVQVSTVSTFASMVVNESVSGATNSTYTVTSALNPSTLYYWRVNATNGPGSASRWSATRNFKTGQ